MYWLKNERIPEIRCGQRVLPMVLKAMLQK
jgi:hypothetical protein